MDIDYYVWKYFELVWYICLAKTHLGIWTRSDVGDKLVRSKTDIDLNNNWIKYKKNQIQIRIEKYNQNMNIRNSPRG